MTDRASEMVEREESYGMSPSFRRFLEVVGDVPRALAAWDIAFEAFAAAIAAKGDER